MNDILAIAFSLSKTWSYKSKKEGIDQAGSFQSFVDASVNLNQKIDFQTAERQFQKLQKIGGWLWTYGDPHYPEALRSIPNPPLVIYGVGQKFLDERNMLAMVGTRNPTPYGKRVGLWLAKDLVREGITLVSGLARGIDSLAHKASVDHQAPTVAVVAHGLDKTFPPENRKLREMILECQGTVISEYPFGISPLAAYFPQRNRIIAGLSKGTLVIEASEKSGTRHTVNHALDQSREIFAVPGPIDSEYSLYVNELIFNGANMVRTSEDILSFYPNRKKREYKDKKSDFKPSKLQRLILQFLDQNDPKSIEEFLAISPVRPHEALQSLTELELHGRVVKQSDSKYVLA
ncbi:MAG: DNA-protecting protein DprA [Proteobacteria bacterium]|jgi:DNA processing protein|nr:DNA-protecting protein DprA [Pseudomonadota bacterium]